MLLYFNNSYTGSYVGYQQTWISSEGTRLALVREDVGLTPFTQSVICSGGAKCVSGQTEDKSYFVFKGIQTSDMEGRIWYINLAIEASAKDRELFSKVVQTILVKNDAFAAEIGNWFLPSEGSQSYEIDSDRFHAFLAAVEPADLRQPYYCKQNYYTGVLKHFVTDLAKGMTHRIELLVPEVSAEYFYKLNPAFAGAFAAYSMPAKPFALLLHRDAALFELPQPIAPWKYLQVPTVDTMNRLRKGAEIAAIAAVTVAVAYGTYRILSDIFEEE